MVNERKFIFYDVLGRQFLEQEFSILFDKMSIDVSFLERGIYFLTIENGEEIETVRLFKN